MCTKSKNLFLMNNWDAKAVTYIFLIFFIYIIKRKSNRTCEMTVLNQNEYFYEPIRYYVNFILWYNTSITPSNHSLNYYTFLYLVLLVLPLSFCLKLVEASCWKGKQGSEIRHFWVPILALLFIYFRQVTQLCGVSQLSHTKQGYHPLPLMVIVT